jgi:hypothetical protein
VTRKELTLLFLTPLCAFAKTTIKGDFLLLQLWGQEFSDSENPPMCLSQLLGSQAILGVL